MSSSNLLDFACTSLSRLDASHSLQHPTDEHTVHGQCLYLADLGLYWLCNEPHRLVYFMFLYFVVIHLKSAKPGILL